MTEITTPWVGQTGEVRLLSKLLNQKVDTVCSRSSRGKTLTVQGLPVCKEAGELGRNASASNGWLASRLAYPTVINQRKQKGNRDSARTSTSLIHFFTPINARSQTPAADLGERVRWCQERRRKKMLASRLMQLMEQLWSFPRTCSASWPHQEHIQNHLPLAAASRTWHHHICNGRS